MVIIFTENARRTMLPDLLPNSVALLKPDQSKAPTMDDGRGLWWFCQRSLATNWSPIRGVPPDDRPRTPRRQPPASLRRVMG
jgi:hypothetical protein